MNETQNKQFVVEELRRSFDREYSAYHALIGKLQNEMSFSSVIISIVSAIEASAFQSKVGVIFWLLLIIALILYLIVVGLILMCGLNPIQYQMPISLSWDELRKKYFHAKEGGVLDLTISEYLSSIEKFHTTNEQKARIVRITSVWMIVMIVLLLIAVPAGLLLPDSLFTKLP